ncbi:MAG: hypothetical protein CME06_17500 [Gemmatimonadetes bacterium]|nr:hypothetical protein [Gemmatimonadota bacterium]
MEELPAAIAGHFAEHPLRLIPLGIAATLISLSLTKKWQPPALRRVTESIQHVAERIVRALAAAITTIALALGYASAMTPVALYWKLTKKDPLRRLAPHGGTLWISHEKGPIDPSSRASRQF